MIVSWCRNNGCERGLGKKHHVQSLRLLRQCSDRSAVLQVVPGIMLLGANKTSSRTAAEN